MILHETQNEVAKDTHRFRVLRMGRRWGKTTLMSEEIKGVVLSKPNARVSYVANNYQQARDIGWELFKKEYAGMISNINEARLEMRTKNGGLIVLRGWESIENLRGQAFDFLCIDEVAMMSKFWVGWQEVLRPTLTDTKGEALFASTPKGYNHFYDLCNLELTDDTFKTFHFTSYDNPHIPVEEIDAAKDTLPEDRFSQEYLADFQKTTGLVYKNFSRTLHTYEEEPQGDFKRVAGVDFGFRNPAAVLEILYDGERVWVNDEWYKSGKTDMQVAEYVAGSNFDAVYPDPENPAAIEEMDRLHVNTREVSKGKGSVEAGIKNIQELLKTGRLKVHKRCVNLISEFETYSYKDTKDEQNPDEKPIKFKDHALDALSYAVRMLLTEHGGMVNKRQKERFEINQVNQSKNSCK